MRNRRFGAVVQKAIASKQIVAARNNYGGTGFEQVRQTIADALYLID
ncbi:hypothetical protein [Picosynechococcus sp. PCC 7003]|nr:hypothetical protein [Picosynechococcus sp. PCC 7003]